MDHESGIQMPKGLIDPSIIVDALLSFNTYINKWGKQGLGFLSNRTGTKFF